MPATGSIYENGRQGPDRRHLFLKLHNYLIYFWIFSKKKRGVCTMVFLKRGPITRQHPENHKF